MNVAGLRSAYQYAREIGGVLLKDLPRYRRALRSADNAWLRLCNRYEQLETMPDGRGVRCDWQWTSVLHAPAVFPSLGRHLLKRAAREYPFVLSDHASQSVVMDDDPDVTFVIGHRGIERVGPLLATLRTIGAQIGIGIECIVVEQSNIPQIRNVLPAWVRYIHTKPPIPEMPYCRAWAFNVGARAARGRMLVLHDNDLLVPYNYAKDHFRYLEAGYEVINLKRFVFYLGRGDTEKLLSDGISTKWPNPKIILQNALGGGSLAIERNVYFDIGGYDESFVGWGGEDNELWDRALLCRVYPFGYLPLIHLWHAEQPDKGLEGGRGRYTATTFDARSDIDPSDRVYELRQRQFGYPGGPDPKPSAVKLD